MYYPRVLVVANNSFSLSNSNGRTLGNMFLGWPKKCLAEFCIGSDGANYNVCNNYYCISDREMLTAFIHFRKANGDRLVRDSYESVSTGIRGKKKTAFRATIRHLLWGHNRWFGKELKEWLEDFSPEIVLVQNGDTSFMFTIARKISCYRDIPLIMFNTEGYCLFKHDWMNKDNLSWLFFPIYKQILRNETQKTMRRLTFIIHGNQLLKVDFDREYGVPSIVVYTGSEVKWSTKTFNSDNPSIVYLGNFGYNRPTSLATVARVFRSLDPKLKIDVYGKPRNEDQIRILTHSEGIVFHGAVPYEQVKGIIENADILLHVEGVEDELQESLRYGFSTKIADCLSSGRPFLLYSRPEIACAQYIIKTGAGWFASNEIELRQQILSLLHDSNERASRLSIAHSMANENHSINQCCLKFQKAIINATTLSKAFSGISSSQ